MSTSTQSTDYSRLWALWLLGETLWLFTAIGLSVALQWHLWPFSLVGGSGISFIIPLSISGYLLLAAAYLLRGTLHG